MTTLTHKDKDTPKREKRLKDDEDKNIKQSIFKAPIDGQIERQLNKNKHSHASPHHIHKQVQRCTKKTHSQVETKTQRLKENTNMDVTEKGIERELNCYLVCVEV